MDLNTLIADEYDWPSLCRSFLLCDFRADFRRIILNSNHEEYLILKIKAKEKKHAKRWVSDLAHSAKK